MTAFAELVPLACDGCFKGYPAVISLVIIVLALIGGIYMLLASNFGARQGYLITMVSLSALMLIMSLIWLLGAPGTTPATGPRGREPAWVPFLPDSDQAAGFAAELDAFPAGWDAPGTIYPGMIDSTGEVQTVRTAIRAAMANLHTVNELDAVEPADWEFRLPGAPAVSDADREKPVAEARYVQTGNTLLFGVTIPATDKHGEVTVFAYRDKGLVFLYALYFFLVSLIGFVVHLWLLARFEKKQKARDAQMESRTQVQAPAPV
ncbi:MAG TPA: hypothetical protein VGB83_03405 [Actinomycetota bacterium]